MLRLTTDESSNVRAVTLSRADPAYLEVDFAGGGTYRYFPAGDADAMFRSAALAPSLGKWINRELVAPSKSGAMRVEQVPRQELEVADRARLVAALQLVASATRSVSSMPEVDLARAYLAGGDSPPIRPDTTLKIARALVAVADLAGGVAETSRAALSSGQLWSDETRLPDGWLPPTATGDRVSVGPGGRDSLTVDQARRYALLILSAVP